MCEGKRMSKTLNGAKRDRKQKIAETG